MSEWTHAICELCWNDRNPEREPVRVQVVLGEPCCFCGKFNAHGIYVRHDPADLVLWCHGDHDEPAPAHAEASSE